MTLSDLFVRSARSGLKQLNDHGAMPSGHNGPYHDNETPVRNTAHWLMVFARAYEISQDVHFYEAVEKCAGYLTSDKARPLNAAFFCRTNPQKDFSNGLIGQAWVFESLQKAARFLKDDSYSKLAREVFLQHPFSEKTSCWHILNVDGCCRSVDITFNHQLWFAACSAGLASGNSEIHQRVEKFVDAMENLFQINKRGLITHHIPSIIFDQSLCRKVKDMVSSSLRSQKERTAAFIKAIGYHAFNLYAFAILKAYFPHHSFWSSPKFTRTISYVQSNEYLSCIDQSAYAFPYNPVGIECAYSVSVFKDYFNGPDELIAGWLTRQILETYDSDNGFMWLNSSDRWTAAARIYEMSRIEDLDMELSS